MSKIKMNLVFRGAEGLAFIKAIGVTFKNMFPSEQLEVLLNAEMEDGKDAIVNYIGYRRTGDIIPYLDEKAQKKLKLNVDRLIGSTVLYMEEITDHHYRNRWAMASTLWVEGSPVTISEGEYELFTN